MTSAQYTDGCLQLSVFSHNASNSLKCRSNLNGTLMVIEQLINRTFVVPNSLMTGNQAAAGGTAS
jgi:hypothetical protein